MPNPSVLEILIITSPQSNLAPQRFICVQKHTSCPKIVTLKCIVQSRNISVSTDTVINMFFFISIVKNALFFKGNLADSPLDVNLNLYTILEKTLQPGVFLSFYFNTLLTLNLRPEASF